EFTSPELPLGSGVLGANAPSLPARSIGLRLDRSISDGIHEDYDLTSYAAMPVRLNLEVAIQSDFADIFDVRWKKIVLRGSLQTAWHQASGELRTSYRNDTFRRDLVVKVDKADSAPQFANGSLVFAVPLEPKGTWHVCLRWLPVIDRRRGRALECHALLEKTARLDTKVLPPVDLDADHPTLPAIWRQAVADMEALRIERFAVGRSVFVPAAGIPWYVTLFGRDSLVVAMESIGGFPEFATGALDRLAAYQATTDDPEQDREPGKVPHELRFGELAELGLLPFAPYYGTHDATPLFMVVLSYAYEWSADKRLLRRYRPAAEAALRWMLESGDRDGDGYQEYATRSTRGLFNQGWKDSAVAIQHEDGRIPSVPIALCELQAYAFDALLRMARIREAFGDDDGSHELRSRARRLYDRFNDDFWWESEGTYYLGLDGHKRPIRSVASNAGHCLAAGLVPPDRADRVVDRLMAPDMWTGWGIRTLSADHPGYNPYAYHLGSVWPHDNATIAGGFRRYGRIRDAQRVAEGIFAAADLFESHRLPELFAGLDREPGGFPVQYLGANVPQAWAAASVFRFVAILCGIHAQGSRRRVYVNPDLPDWLPSITLRNLRAGKGAMDLRMERDKVDVL
ncbi:MAG TPA: glycogen debranching N-terminal domain-containing protein, partial [Patescibacteria group bacterium]|nr:glycogen debranching N-terminal domain-containing protein [Patescibacteria group bacterium]